MSPVAARAGDRAGASPAGTRGARDAARGPRRLDPLGAVPAAVVLVAVALTLPPVTGVLLGEAWMVPVLVCAALALVPVAALRVVRAPDGLLTVAGAVALLAAVSAVYFPSTTVAGVVPTPATLTAAGNALTATSDLVRTSVIPVEADTGTLLLLSVAAGLIGLVVEALAFSLRMPALGGVPLVALLLVPALMRPDSIGVAGFAGGAVAYLLVLATGHAWSLRRVSAGSPRRAPAGTDAGDGAVSVAPEGPGRASDPVDSAPAGWVSTAMLCVVVLIVSLALPAAVPGFTTGLFPQGSRLRLVDPDDRVSPLIRLGDDLKAPQAGRGEVRYSTTADTPLYLRMSTITALEGSQWGPDPDDRSYQALRNSLTGSRPVPEGATDYARVITSGYAMPWLPLPQNSRFISTAEAGWVVNPSTGDVRTADGRGYRSAEYATQLVTPELTRQQLLASPNRVPASLASTLQLPARVPAVVTETADRIAATTPDHFARALAIQQFLRGGDFSYSLDAPGRNGYDGTGIRIVGEFLTRREGYCVHFASTMAVLARLMGIPSRIVVGLGPGRTADDAVGDVSRAPRGQGWQTFTSDSRDAHAWPELWFEDYGWVPFEPTPGRGVLPDYTVAPGSGAAAAPNDDLDPQRQQGAAPSAATEPAPATSTPGGATSDATAVSSRWLLALAAGGVVVAVLLLVPALVRAGRRRRRLERVRGGDVGDAAVAAWEEVVDTAVDVGRGSGGHETPRGFLARLGASADPASGALPVAAADRLVEAVERARYGPPVAAGVGGPTTGAGTGHGHSPEQDGARLRAADVEELRAALLRPLSRPARWGAALAPRSLLAGARPRTAVPPGPRTRGHRSTDRAGTGGGDRTDQRG
ncbi:hypothetical protein GCM10011512_19890 [Tersicoccus solisilvae]|uniref:Transglutaminase-like domain-containing protein n=1 Tax=Tersicoccus solisilvae TaxID=1882339 RepID=A0ABQ1P7P4_9MICC|nr:DUF3488 and transglutaminase-like domain-containing protein [Tersicoccus solisilvae]GGC92829.1 hypothetical protein GCM10011512_19890 [Tersicoccus solisilvae]